MTSCAGCPAARCLLALQARFGARTGAAPVFLGLLKVTLGLLLGSSLFQLLQAFPQPLLGELGGAGACATRGWAHTVCSRAGAPAVSRALGDQPGGVVCGVRIKSTLQPPACADAVAHHCQGMAHVQHSRALHRHGVPAGTTAHSGGGMLCSAAFAHGSKFLFLFLSAASLVLAAGAMLVYAGVQLAACARKQRGERGVAVMLLTATVVLAMGNVAVGVAAGMWVQRACRLRCALAVATRGCTTASPF